MSIAPTLRSWGPLVLGIVALMATLFAGPLLTWLLLLASFGLILDGATVMWQRAGSSGNLRTHRQ